MRFGNDSVTSKEEARMKRMIGLVLGLVLALAGIGAAWAETWVNLGIMTCSGIAVYGALCLIWWRISGKGIQIRRKASS